MKKENIWNIPNALTLVRVLFTPLVIYLIFAEYNPLLIIGSFAIGMLTDFFDGMIAKRFKLQTEFGRKFDMIADRILVAGAVLAFLINFAMKGSLTANHIFQVGVVFSREIIAFPFAITAFVFNSGIPHARFVGKLTTFVQAVALCFVLLEIYYSRFDWVFFVAAATGILGAISALTYIQDVLHAIRAK